MIKWLRFTSSMSPPIGLTASTSIFAAFSILLWLTVRAETPWLRDTFGVLPIIAWFVSWTAFVLVPILLSGCAMAWRELPKRSPSALKKRLSSTRWIAAPSFRLLAGFRYYDCFGDYIARMEDVLALYEKPLSESEPVVCVDEKPVVLHATEGRQDPQDTLA